MKMKELFFLLILGSYGVNAAPMHQTVHQNANNFNSDPLDCGSATFSNNDDVSNYFKAFPDCTQAATLTFRHAGSIDFSPFNQLISATELIFYDTNFSKVSELFTNLNLVGEINIENSKNLEDLSFPKLYVAGNISIRNSTNLSSEPFPELIEGDELNIKNTTGFDGLTFPNLTNMYKITLNGINQAVSLTTTFPALETLERLELLWNDKLKEITLPNLSSLKALYVEYNAWLQKVSIPNLANSEISQLSLAENNQNFDGIGGQKGGLPDIKKINDKLTLIGTKFSFDNYPKAIKTIHFFSELTDDQIKTIANQLPNLNPRYSKDEKTKVYFDNADCRVLNSFDTSKFGYDFYAGSEYPKKCSR